MTCGEREIQGCPRPPVRTSRRVVRADVQRRCEQLDGAGQCDLQLELGDATTGTGKTTSIRMGPEDLHVTLSVTDAGGTSTRRSQ